MNSIVANRAKNRKSCFVGIWACSVESNFQFHPVLVSSAWHWMLACLWWVPHAVILIAFCVYLGAQNEKWHETPAELMCRICARKREPLSLCALRFVWWRCRLLCPSLVRCEQDDSSVYFSHFQCPYYSLVANSLVCGSYRITKWSPMFTVLATYFFLRI